MPILVDYSGIAIANIFTQKEKPTEGLVRHMILNSLRMYNVKYREKYGQMILACDGGNTWRRSMFPQYKANRKKSRDEGGLDWTEFFRILGQIREEIAQNLPFKVIHLDTIEADDIIATLTERTQDFGQGDRVMIISADKDFIQLQRYPNVSQFSPMTKALLKESNPIRYLQEHIIRGDSGDGVPNILSGDSVFVEGERQTPISSKKVDNWIDNWETLSSVMDEQTLRNFQRNTALIDLSKIPADKKSLIINTADTMKVSHPSKVLSYLISKRCSNLIECAGEFSPHNN